MDKAELKKSSYYVRKRDKMLVQVDVFDRSTVTYVTQPMLVQYVVKIESFLRGYRPAQKEDISRDT